MTLKRLLLLAALAALVSCGREQVQPVADAGDDPPVPTDTCVDNDGDGVPGTGECKSAPVVDCNDNTAVAFPGAAERCNGEDDDCDGKIDEELPDHPFFEDKDGDGVGSTVRTGQGCGDAPPGSAVQTGDCDDQDKAIRPGLAETCNGKDEDCNGQVDDSLPTQNFYPDRDGDSFGDAASAAQASCAPAVAGKVPNSRDCDDQNPTIKPGATELCNLVDDDCDGRVDNGTSYSNYYADGDGDGFGAAGSAAQSSCTTVPGKVTNDSDCNDQNPTIKPTAPETCNGLDDNCSGAADENLAFSNYYRDQDGDGFGAAGDTATSSCKPVAGEVTNNSDCNDANPGVKPTAPELCNGADDNCSGSIDEGLTFRSYYADGDGDGYGAGAAQSACAAVAGKVTNNSDCNDANAAVKPSAAETCNGVDDNCSGAIDEGLTFQSYWPDADGDGYGNAAATALSACAPVSGRVTNNQDCNDALFGVKPGATEVCNGLDDNCAGGVDEGLSFTNWWPDVDGDTFGSSAAAPVSACAPVAGRVGNNTDCNDGNASIRPGAPEACNGLDDNCDNLVDNGTVTQSFYPDNDADGYGDSAATAQVACTPPPNKVANNQDCNDASAAIKPGALEVCDGVDNNCSGAADEGLTFLSYWPDVDGDGYGAQGAGSVSACAPVSGRVTNNQDCNDANLAVKPGATEVCNGVDDNCAGGVDEGLPTQSYWPDVDGDGFGAQGQAAQASCGPVAGKVTNASDCNDASAAVRPTATEACNGVDDDCDTQVDEGNPGGGGSCSTGQSGICGPGTRTCQAGALVCLRNQSPTAEACNNLDDDCDGNTDEDFTNKGNACSAGLGVCLRSGAYVCRADGTGTQCSATSGSPTAAACDGLDNDCDGTSDEPELLGTVNLSTSVAWRDVEVEPYYLSPGSCAGGANGTGTDALAGGGLALAGGAAGFYFQKLDLSGNPSGTPVAAASGLSYTEVDLAQAGDGFLMAGLYESGGVGREVDLYYMDGATGAKRTYLWSQFNTGNTLDSLRVVRGNGRRVAVLWREANVGLKLARFEVCPNGSAWEIKGPGCGAVSASTLIAGAQLPPGLGADSSHDDWSASQTCPGTASLRKLAVAYLTTATSLNHFTVNEDGSGKSAEVVVRAETSPRSLALPEVAFFRSASADQWFVAYVTKNPSATPANADLNYWLTTSTGWHYAYLQYATSNGVDSIDRPRASVTSTRVWLSGGRSVADPSGFLRQVMTRTIDFSGTKDPTSSSVEQSATSGACGSAPACRPGDKHGLANWAPFGKVYFSASGATPTGAFSAALVCQ